MSKPDGVDTEDLRNRLPAGWTVEAPGENGTWGGDAVVGQSKEYEAGRSRRAAERGANFEIRRTGDLWTAIWLDHRGSGPDRATDRITGVRERCVEWVVERARGAEETAGE